MVPRLEHWGTTFGPQGKGHHADFPFLFPRVASKAQYQKKKKSPVQVLPDLGFLPWTHVPQVSHVEQPKEKED